MTRGALTRWFPFYKPEADTGSAAATATTDPEGAADGTKAADDTGKATAEGDQGAGSGDKGTTSDPEHKADAPASKVPERYDYVVPEEAKAFVDPTMLEALAARAKAKGLTMEQAQEQLEELIDERVAMSDAFQQQTLADPTYGGDKLADTQRYAQAAIRHFRPQGHARAESFNKLLIQSGFGNNLDVISFLADVGKAMAEDSPGAGSSGVTRETKGPLTTEEAADRIYGAK